MPIGDRGGVLGDSEVAAIVAEQFPELAGRSVMWLGEGWDFETFSLGGEWVFRFPRRSVGVAAQQREELVLKVVTRSLGELVPQIHYRGRASESFPHPFVGYRLLPGVPADASGVDLDRVAAGLGVLLGRVHQIEQGNVPPALAGWPHKQLEDVAEEALGQVATIRPALPSSLRERVDCWLSGNRSVPAAGPIRRFCHNDICAEHILVSRDGTVRGVIDWTDAMITDPAVDFAGLITIGGWSFTRQVIAQYPLALDAQFDQRLGWLTRMLTLIWLADATRSDESTERQQEWVERAFRTSSVASSG